MPFGSKPLNRRMFRIGRSICSIGNIVGAQLMAAGMPMQWLDRLEIIRGYSATVDEPVPAASGGAKPKKLLNPFGGIHLPVLGCCPCCPRVT